MHKGAFFGIAFLLLRSACTPAAMTAPPQVASPMAIITPTTVIVENPPACATANMTYHTRLQEVLMTGCTPTSGERSSMNVIWGWNGERWHRVAEGGPNPLVLGGTAYDEKRDVVVLYGGYSLEENKCARETWEWDGETWTKKEVESPAPCDHVEMVYDASRGEVILFGGGDENQNLNTRTWSWNGERWNAIADAGPPGRAHFGLVYDNAHEQILLYGGYADKILEDFWAWKSGEWQQISLPGPGPLSHAGVALYEDGLIIFGGASTTSTFSSLSDKTWKLTDGAWSQLELETHPSRRGSPAMAYDPGRKRIVLYGGFAPARSEQNDTWEWDGNEWSCIMNCK